MDSQYTTRSAAAADDVERAATGSLDNLAIRVAATGSLLLDGIFSLLLVNYNEDVGFFFFGLKCRKAKSGGISKADGVPIEDTRGGFPLILTIRLRFPRTTVVLSAITSNSKT